MSQPPTFLFADLAGFTALTETHGDETAADIAGNFCAQVQELLPEYRAEAVKTIGDAVMVRCDDAAGAIVLALRIVHEIGERHGSPIVRVGMHTGPAIERAGDWFGATVNLAARVSSMAGGGEVLLTDATRKAAGPIGDVDLAARGHHRLRNVADEVAVYLARHRRPSQALAVDPVCRMAVDAERCAGHLRYEARTYHFCSLDCAQQFAADPVRFVGSR